MGIRSDNWNLNLAQQAKITLTISHSDASNWPFLVQVIQLDQCSCRSAFVGVSTEVKKSATPAQLQIMPCTGPQETVLFCSRGREERKVKFAPQSTSSLLDGESHLLG